MKSFGDFIFECYFNKFSFSLFEGKYSDEHAFRKVWNHFITHRKYGKEIRDLINSGKYDEAREAMEKEIADAKKDPKHPLSFEKAKRGFQKGKDNNLSQSQSTYYDELKLAPDSVVAYTKGRRGKSAANRSTAYAKVEGGATPPTTRMWKVVGKEADTSKRDISIADTRDKKFGQGISLKQGEGSQTLSAEPEEVRGLFQAAAKKYIQKLKKDGASKEDIEKFKADVESNISKYIRAQSLKISPTENKTKNDKRLSIAQSAVDSLVKNYPGFDRLVDKEAAGGEQKFGKKVSAQMDSESQDFKDALTALRTYKSGVEGAKSKINLKDLEQGEYGRVESIVKKYKKNPKQLASILNNMKKDNKKYPDTLTALKVIRGTVDMGSLEKGERERVQSITNKYKTYQELSDYLKSSPSGEAREVVRGTYVDPKTGEVVSRAKAEPVSQRGEPDQPLTPRSGKGKSSKREDGYRASEMRRRGEKPERIQRSGALAGRVGPAKPDADKKDNQAKPQQGPITGAQSERRAKLAAAEADPDIQNRRKELRNAAAAQKQAQKALSDAEREQADARVVTNNGKRVRRQHVANFLQNNPDVAQQHAARQAAAAQAVDNAQKSVADIQARAAQAREKTKPQPAPQQQPEPTKPEAPQPQVKQEPVPVPKPEEKKKKKPQSELQKRMYAAGEKLGLE